VVLEKGDSVRIDPPTFGEYRLSAELAGASFQGPARVRFLCNPNNPTGILLSREEVLSELARCREEGTQLFLDEAFMDLSEPAASVSGVRDDHLFVLRSLTKAFSVPGIRFGYGFGPPDLIEKIETARTPWTVTAFAEQYAVAAFSRYDALRESAQKIAAERKWFCAELDALGLSYGKSSVNYLLIGVNGDAAAFSGRMLSHGVLVRDCTSFGLPASIRVSIGTRDVNRQVLEALSSCLR
jgi:threonine-phosphate decarboxylase